ncbi:hypothetical protein QBC46DRAFT_398640 [Diplogelasinospora grovesii]|uniref:Uncharacterized protein n=1 Tax=Diplogelasinospora grovesii TaxID=303347 RepID=A0AAN6MXS7_9PEZI|nr:hypothetical protein QBC46DRAFT_398640 [Diplogelasinospora grovesii]
MPYHLAFYHLDCIRRQFRAGLDLAKAATFIPELSCSGTSSFDQNGRHEYSWSSDVYFDKGTFLQKQEIRCVMERGGSYPSEIRLTCCPHDTLILSSLSYGEENGFLLARMWVGRSSMIQVGFPWRACPGWWCSKEGRHAGIIVCATCHSDAESTIELLGNQVHVRFTCYRDLGPATNRYVPRWTALLTGKGMSYRSHNDYSLYARVWRTAQKLGRPDLHLITHQREYHGEFVADSST